MDSEPKKPQIDEEAILMEMEEAERQEIDDRMELKEDETNSSREEDDDDDDEDDDKDDENEREEAKYDMLMTQIKDWDLPELVEKMRAKEKRRESESEEDTDEDEEEDTDDDEDGIELWEISRGKEDRCGKA
jgi:hypothetical protein